MLKDKPPKDVLLALNKTSVGQTSPLLLTSQNSALSAIFPSSPSPVGALAGFSLPHYSFASLTFEIH